MHGSQPPVGRSPQLIEDLDRQQEIDRARTDLTSSYLLSESNAKFDALEEELEELAKEIKASKADLQVRGTAITTRAAVDSRDFWEYKRCQCAVRTSFFLSPCSQHSAASRGGVDCSSWDELVFAAVRLFARRTGARFSYAAVPYPYAAALCFSAKKQLEQERDAVVLMPLLIVAELGGGASRGSQFQFVLRGFI